MVTNVTNNENTRVFVSKNGIVKDVTDHISTTVIEQLEKAYEEAPIVGLSFKTYSSLINMFDRSLESFYNTEINEKELYSKTVAFAENMGIDSIESPYFFDVLLRIEREVTNHKDFSSKDISMKCLRDLVSSNYPREEKKCWRLANADFRKWAHERFEYRHMRIGIVRFLKFYYGVITSA